MDDRIVLDKGQKRQLPQWMFATSAADQVKKKVKTDHVDSNNNNTEEEIVTQKRSRLKNRKTKDKKEAFTGESSTKISVCQTTKRSRRKLNLSNDDCNDESGLMGSERDRMKVNGNGTLPMLRRQKQKMKNSKIEGGEMEESKTKASDRSGLRKRKCSSVKDNSNEAGPSLRRQKLKVKTSRKENCADVEESTPKTDDEDLTVEDLLSIAEEYAGDSDEDLTVEDLLSIAKEYVNENEQAASGKGKSGPVEDVISMSTGSLNCSELDNQSLRRDERHSDSIPITETRVEDAPPKVNMSENPTQDMLDVFLGPLLKKTHEEKRVELVREDMMSLAHDLNKKNQSDPSEGHPVLVKKKSSLKDKVALLLD
ncbi:uncharacterized protein [Nicotiana sylvestris]|uniref:Uncharacterized protein LOC104245216 n=1 Tax=Nicotiana sylvestris TaxID=4096 RepID=A0A1U7YAX2_NICSY|nr:PREDICTED: uncharacterized protein LOC104245216 [Nicotiana sylvestris]XP_009799096.1 PREDICTED: uncharacterized protein LOC104245216 [Nicotiana sylvestris]